MLAGSRALPRREFAPCHPLVSPEKRDAIVLPPISGRDVNRLCPTVIVSSQPKKDASLRAFQRITFHLFYFVEIVESNRDWANFCFVESREIQ